jgi:hypothetical protein
MESDENFRIAYYLVKTLGPVQFWKKMESYNFFWKAYYLIFLVQTPSWRPNNLPQPAWRLRELLFWSDLSWLRADLCLNSYVISTHFSLLSTMPSCTHYISNIGTKTGLNSFWDFPYVTTFLLRSISVFYLWKTERFRKELSPPETVIFDHAILERDPSQKYWTTAISERMESDEIFWIAYYFVKTLGPAQCWKEWSLTKLFGTLTTSFT